MADFIVLEGPDGSGTTTQARLLSEYLQKKGLKVLITAEPTSGSIGRYIRTILKENAPFPADALQLLFCADRAKHLQETVLPALQTGITVICDRYFHSTLCYGQAMGLDIAWLKTINSKFRLPEKTIFLMPPLAICLKRIKERINQEFLETEQIQKKVYEAYQQLAAAENIPKVDSAKTIAEVTKAIIEII